MNSARSSTGLLQLKAHTSCPLEVKLRGLYTRLASNSDYSSCDDRQAARLERTEFKLQYYTTDQNWRDEDAKDPLCLANAAGRGAADYTCLLAADAISAPHIFARKYQARTPASVSRA